MSSSVTMKGQAWIYDNSQVIQDQTLITTNGTSENTVVLVEDIWEDLLSGTGKWKVSDNNKKYFYWEYKQTDTASQLADGSYSEVTIKLECPKPKPGLIEALFIDKNTGYPVSPKDWADEDIEKLGSDWAKYWATEIKLADYNYNKVGSLQKKEVSFVTKERISYDKDTQGVVISETTVTEINNTEFGNNPNCMQGDNLITDLLNMF